MRSVLIRGLGVAVAAVVVASCSSSPNAANSKQAVLDAYRQSWADLIAAGDPVTPDAPDLDVHRSGKALEVIKAILRDYSAKGVIFRGAVDLHPKVVELNGDTAKISDCVFDHTEVLDPATNQIVKPAANHPRVLDATMEVVHGAWKVIDFVPQDQACTPKP